MPAPVVGTEAIVLKKTPSGEKFFRVEFITPGNAVLSGMIRKKTGKDTTGSIDIFDQGELHIELKEGGNSGFIKDFAVETKRIGIGSSYQSLVAASRLAKFVLSNPVHEENSLATFRLIERSLNSLNEGKPSNAVLLKTLYLYCRDEGYPIREDWARNLDENIHSLVAEILNTPLDDIQSTPLQQSAVLDSLTLYLQHHTDIHFN